MAKRSLLMRPRWKPTRRCDPSGGGTTADPVVDQGTAYFEEFALRPLAASYLQFENIAALVAHRASLDTPPPYAVLDSLPTGGSPTDPRTQLELALVKAASPPVLTMMRPV